MTEVVRIEKLVHGGQGLASLADGRRVFIWNTLPDELVMVDIKKKKRQLAEGIATEIIEASPERIEPLDEAYLSTSPWQMMTWEAENTYKQQILQETMEREHVAFKSIDFHAGQSQLHYRNKMEYSFWADDEGLHLALFHRASHGKRIITGSSIARPEIDDVATKILGVLNKAGVRGSQLKTIIVRCNQAGETVAALFVKDEAFPELAELRAIGRGVAVYYSNPKSPASVLTEELYMYGDVTLTDDVLGQPVTYDVNSFFQVNLEIFESAGRRIADVTKDADKKVDMYSGVGTIGIACGADTLVEIDARNILMAQYNVARIKRSIEVVHASAETALEYVTSDSTLIVDPPRAGLHARLTERIHEVLPPTVVYLSCNPSTQARDIALLQDKYELESLEGYNFFPRTPHIESLAVLKRR